MSFHGLPCWYELASTDLTKSQNFYADVLEWKWADSGTPGMDYRLAKRDGSMVAGLFAAQDGMSPAWTIYFAVSDADVTAAQAEALGATIVVPPSDIPGTGRFAMLIDPQGAGFAILQPLDGGTGGAFDQSKRGHGNWHELITPDPAAGLAFYGSLFGWTETRSVPMGPEMTYHVIGRQGLEIGGTCKLPGIAAHWKPYFAVVSAAAAKLQVAAAGGVVTHGPDEVPGGAFTLQVTDPMGTIFALVGPA